MLHWKSRLTFGLAAALVLYLTADVAAQDVRVARGFTQVAIATGTTAYTLSTADALAPVTDTDLPACKDVTRIRGRFVWVPSDGSSLIFSEVNDAGNLGPASRFDAESYPDLNVAIENIKNDLYALNQESIEPFRDVGPEDFPFVPVSNAVMSVGYVAGKILTKDSLIFLGKDKDNGYAFFIISDGLPQIISSAPINEMLNQDYNREELEGVRAQRFNWRGVDCYVFSFYDRTLIYAGGNWNYLDQGINSAAVRSTFDYYHAVLLGSTWYLQAADGIYKLTTEKSDTKGDFARQFVTYARSPQKARFQSNYVELENLQGTTNLKGSIGLAVSRTPGVWSPQLYVDLAEIGRSNDTLRWSSMGGLGQYDGWMGLNVYTTDPIEFAAENLLVDI